VLVRAHFQHLPVGAGGTVPVAWEYGSYLMAAAFTFGAAMTLRAAAIFA
jgi:hypothetical protein